MKKLYFLAQKVPAIFMLTILATLGLTGQASAHPLDDILNNISGFTSSFGTFAEFTYIGFTHILPLGVDHILFVLGLFLLSPTLPPLFWQVTAFTLAHTVTLALTIFGLVAVPPSIVEPIIALSITFIAIENLITKELKPWRILVVFAFGLIHGMGFAGVLSEIGLPAGAEWTALIAFNIGVEFGQLAVIGLAMGAVWLFRKEDWYRPYVAMPSSVIIGLIGAVWFVERIV